MQPEPPEVNVLSARDIVHAQGESGPVSVRPSRRPISARVKPGDLTVHLRLVEACHLRVALDDRFELGVAHNLMEVCKTVGSPLLHHVDDTLWTARAVVLDDLSR